MSSSGKNETFNKRTGRPKHVDWAKDLEKSKTISPEKLRNRSRLQALVNETDRRSRHPSRSFNRQFTEIDDSIAHAGRRLSLGEHEAQKLSCTGVSEIATKRRLLGLLRSARDDIDQTGSDFTKLFRGLIVQEETCKPGGPRLTKNETAEIKDLLSSEEYYRTQHDSFRLKKGYKSDAIEQDLDRELKRGDELEKAVSDAHIELQRVRRYSQDLEDDNITLQKRLREQAKHDFKQHADLHYGKSQSIVPPNAAILPLAAEDKTHLTTELKNTNDRLRRSEKTLDDLRQAYQMDRTSWTVEKKVLQSHVQRLEGTTSQLHHENQQLTEQLWREIGSLKERLKAYERAESGLRIQLEAAKLQQRASIPRPAEPSRENANLWKEYNQLNNETKVLRQQNLDLQSRTQNIGIDRDDVNKQKSLLKHENASLRHTVRDQSRQIQLAMADVRAARHERRKLRQEMQRLKEERERCGSFCAWIRRRYDRYPMARTYTFVARPEERRKRW